MILKWYFGYWPRWVTFLVLTPLTYEAEKQFLLIENPTTGYVFGVWVLVLAGLIFYTHVMCIDKPDIE